MPKSVTGALFAEIDRLVAEHGPKWFIDETGLPRQTAYRMMDPEAKRSFNRDTFEALIRVPEIRAAVAMALQRRSDSDWDVIAGELADIISPTLGWVLVRRLRRLDELGLLHESLESLEGLIEGRAKALAAEQAAKSAKSKGKRKKA